MSPAVIAVHEKIDAALAKLRPSFTPDCQLTFIMRKPGMPTAGIIVSNDDLDAVIQQVDWFKANEPKCTVRKRDGE